MQLKNPELCVKEYIFRGYHFLAKVIFKNLPET